MSEQDRDDIKSASPDWTRGGRVHDWRNHVGARTKMLWATFTFEQRMAIYEDADLAASNELWE